MLSQNTWKVGKSIKNNFGKNLLSKKRKFSRKSFLDTLTVMLKGFLSYQSVKGGESFGLLPINSLLQPRMSFKRYQSTSYDFLQLFDFAGFIMTSSGVISNRITKIKILNSSKFFFFIKHDVKLQKR